MEDKKVIFASHTAYYEDNTPRNGTGSQIAGDLHNRRIAYMFIKHSLYEGHTTRIESFNGKQMRVQYVGNPHLPIVLRAFQDLLVTFRILFPLRGNISMYIGIDPLNAVIGILLKPIISLPRVVFYTADYARARFSNPALNWLYHSLDYFARTYSSVTWCVSTRMMTLRKKQNIPGSKLVFVPNAPLYTAAMHKTTPAKYTDIVIVSGLREDYIDFAMAFEAIKYVSKKIPHVRLVIVGSGDDEQILRKKVRDMNMQTHVLFTGKKSHADVYAILKKSTIGLALYRTTSPWTYYGDSMKTREYLSVGLPVIITDTCSTADDIKKEHVGVVIPESEKHLGRILASLLKNNKLLNTYRKNALLYSKKTNIRNIIEREIV